MKESFISLKNISKIYETSEIESTVLKDINLELIKGDYYSISGPSGSGKSTLLSIIGLLDSSTSGKVQIAGKDITNLNQQDLAQIRNEKVGFVFQSFNLIDDLNVFDNVALALHYRRPKLSAEEVKSKVNAALEAVEISHRSGHYPSQLSGGQQQRVGVARALAAEPEFILFDEPTGNLDSSSSEKVMELIKKLNEKGIGIVIVTHEEKYADMATNRLFLLDGKLVENSKALLES